LSVTTNSRPSMVSARLSVVRSGVVMQGPDVAMAAV